VDPLQWLAIDGIEIANGAQALSYMRAGLVPGPWTVYSDLGHLPDAGEIDCVCEHLSRWPYHDPVTDGAAWVDPTFPPSAEFLGVIPSRITVEGGPIRGVTPMRLGSVLGARTTPGRTVTIAGVLIARSGVGLDYGEQWLSRLVSPFDDPCRLPDLSVMPSCPSESLLVAETDFDHQESDGWTANAATTTIEVVDTDLAWRGPGALRVTSTGSSTQVQTPRSIADEYHTPATPGVRYTLRLALSGDDQPGADAIDVSVNFLWGPSGVGASRVVTLQPGTQQEVTMSAVARPGANSLAVELVGGGSGGTAGDVGDRYYLDHVRVFAGPDPEVVLPRVGVVQPLTVEPSFPHTCVRPFTIQLVSEAAWMIHAGGDPVADLASTGGDDSDLALIPASGAHVPEALDVTVHNDTPADVENLSAVLYEVPAEAISTSLTRPQGWYTYLDGATVEAGELPVIAEWNMLPFPAGLTARWEPATRSVTVTDADGDEVAGWEGLRAVQPAGLPLFDLPDSSRRYLIALRAGGSPLLPFDAATFRAGLAGWGANDPWANPGTFLCSTVGDTTQAHIGGGSLRATATGSGQPYLYVDRSVTGVAHGQRVRASGWARQIGGARTARLDLIFYTPAGATLASKTGPTTTLTDAGIWYEMFVDEVVPVNAAWVKVRWVVNTPANGQQFWLDEVWLRHGPPDSFGGTVTLTADRRVLVQ
jgi:hypothetical protein